MIRRLLHYSSPQARRLLIAELACIVVAAVLQGVAFLMLVPLLRALLREDFAGTDSVGTWLGAAAVVGVLYVAAAWFASHIGMKASTAVLASLLKRLGDRSRLITGTAIQGGDVRLLHALCNPQAQPHGLHHAGHRVVRMYFFDWRLALAMTVMVPVLLVGYRRLRDVIARGDAVHSEAVADASSRVIEFARVQPTLRTARDGSIADRLVEDALQNQHRAYRGILVTGGAGIATFAGLVQLSLTRLLAVGGGVDVATPIALFVLGVRFNEPIVGAGALGGGIALALARTSLDQLDELAAVKALSEPHRPGTPAD